MQRVQFNLPKDLKDDGGFPCHRISREVRSRMCFAVVFSLLVSCFVYCFADVLEKSLLFTAFTVLLKT